MLTPFTTILVGAPVGSVLFPAGVKAAPATRVRSPPAPVPFAVLRPTLAATLTILPPAISASGVPPVATIVLSTLRFPVLVMVGSPVASIAPTLRFAVSALR